MCVCTESTWVSKAPETPDDPAFAPNSACHAHLLHFVALLGAEPFECKLGQEPSLRSGNGTAAGPGAGLGLPAPLCSPLLLLLPLPARL